MLDKVKTCTLCGLRPHKLPASLDSQKLTAVVEHEIRKCVFQGFTVFQTGMAMGSDIWAAKIVVRLKREFPNVRLVCFLPCETQANRWTNAWREEYFSILAAADDVICLQSRYTTGCMQRRNRRMLDGSSRLIAVYDGTSNGGTKQTIQYAKKKGVDVVIINPRDCTQA